LGPLGCCYGSPSTLNQRVRSSSLRRPTIFSLSSAQLFDAFSAILKREKALSSVSLSAGASVQWPDQRGVRHIRENRDDGIRALRKYVGLDAKEAAAGYDEYRESFPLDGRILDIGITATIEQEIETGRLKGRISLNEMTDLNFINSVGKRKSSRQPQGISIGYEGYLIS
jgi:hypothetical protein